MAEDKDFPAEEIQLRLKLVEKSHEKHTELISRSIEKIGADIAQIKDSFAELKVIDTRVKHVEDTLDSMKETGREKASVERVNALETRLVSIEEHSKTTMRTAIFTLITFLLTSFSMIIMELIKDKGSIP